MTAKVGSGCEMLSTAPRDDIFHAYHAWSIRNYGENGKTKTVTRKKYKRIIKILELDQESTDNSKFKFWVKSKGFRLGSRAGLTRIEGEEPLLYVPTKVTAEDAPDEDRVYKRVAVVEDFFDIIYSVHVEMEGRSGKHAGQKRTYKAISETYSFIPREAVTHFLLSCADCQKRMHSGENNNVTANNSLDQPIIDYSMPITTAYLNHMRGKGQVGDGFMYQNGEVKMEEDSMSSISDVSVPTSDSPIPALGGLSPMPPDLKKEGEKSLNNNSRTDSPVNLKTETAVTSFPLSVKAPTMVANGLTEPAVAEKLVPTQIGSSPSPRFTPTDLEQTKIDKGHPERKRRASDEISVGSSTKASDGAADDNGKDDDDDDDDESEEKTSIEHDPERLKAFNMFCRLFVDENLDRTVPISKQPKDKIQAILEACDRQFPEFHGRSRKRIRTYLKSCRRMRRSKENGWEPLRPTPPHLTSAAAEQLLAQACENETNNAKRMRMGLDPLPASAMGLPSTGAVQPSQTPEKPAKTQPPVPQPSAHQSPVLVSHQPQPPVSHQPPALERQPVTSVASVADYMRHTGAAAPTAFRPPHEIHNPFLTNGNGLFRPGFPGAGFQHQAHHHPPVMQHSTIATQLQNGLPVSGPTDLSIKKSQASSKTQLNSSEIATIKQLIAGYRESAAFLYRSADELETLLQQQN